MTALDRVFRPRSVAIVGGDEAERVAQQLDLLGFTGHIWPVHPNRSDLAGRRCFPTVDALPGSPDVAFTAVPRHITPEIVRSLAKRGSGGVVVYTSGFGEAGAVDLEQELVYAAGEMPLIGPNCYGYVNALDGTAVWPDVHGLTALDRGVGILTQSGNIGINLTMARRSLPLAMVVTAGNQASVDIPTLMDALLDDPRITAIGIQLEDLADARAFGKAATRAARQGIPVVALKMGSSERGALVTESHTGALAGDDDAYSTLFARYGVARARTIPAFLETLKLAGVVPASPSVISMSASGGEAAHVADLASSAGVRLPHLEPEHVAAIEATVDELVTISNPMDYHTLSWGNEEELIRTFAAVVDGPCDLAMLVLDFPTGEVPVAWWTACRAFATAVGDKPGLLVSSLPETMPEEVQAMVRAMGLIPTLGIAETIEAIAALGAVETGEAGLHIAGRTPSGRLTTLDEARSKAMLRQAGIPVPDGTTTSTPLSAPVRYPVTIKALGISHKAPVGAVAVGVRDQAALRDVLEAMPHDDQYLLEETVTGGLVELLVSLRVVGELGWLLTVGAGGLLVEVIDDRSHLLVPVSRPDVESAIASLRIGASLQDRVGRAGRNAVIDTVMALQDLPMADDGLVEVEINPLIVKEDRVIAVDAMVTLS